MNEEILQKLYSNASTVFNVPPYEQFVIDMQDEAKLIRFRESMAEHYDIPDLETLKKDIGFTTQLESEVIPEEQDLTQQDLTDKLSRGDVDFDPETMGSEEAQYSQRESKGLGSPMTWGDMDVMYDKDATDFEKSLAFVNKDLFERDEETVVPKLNYHFNDYGFKFEESGMLDNVTVTAPNGKQETFDIDSWIIASNKKESLKLRNFLRKNKRETPLNELSDQYKNNRKKYFSRAAVDSDIKLIRAESEDLAKRMKEYQSRKAKHDDAMNQFLSASPEMYENQEFQEAYQRQLAEGRYLATQQTELTGKFKDFKGYSESINVTTGNYILTKESGGGFLIPFKGFWDKELEGGGSIMTSLLVDGGMDLFMQFVQNTINPEYGFEDNEFKEDFVKYYNKFYASQYGPVPEGVLEDETKFKEWTQTLKLPQKGEETEGMVELRGYAQGAGEDVNYFKQPDGTYRGLDDELYDMTKGVKYVMETPGFNPLSQPEPVMKVYSTEYDDWVTPPRTLSATNVYEKVLAISQDQEIKESKAPIKAITRDFLVEMFGFDEVSDEQIEAQMNQGGLMGVLATGWYGAGESIPALLPMIYAAWKGKKSKYMGAKGFGKRFTQALKNFATDGYRQTSLISMALLQNDKLMEQMENDPDFEFVTENEKKMMIAPLAIVTGMLETMGFRHLLKGSPGLVANIMGEAFKRIPKGATPALFRRTVKNIIDNRLTRGVVNSGLGRFGGRVLPAMAAEFETGGLQEIADLGAKDIYNNIKGKEMFDKPEMWSAEFWDQVAFSAMAEAVGGLVMSTPGGIISAASGNDQIIITDQMVELFDEIKNDDAFVNAYLTQLDLEVAQGNISKFEAEKKKSEFAVLRAAATDLDVVEDLDPTSKKEALQLMFRKNQLQSKMEGMDKDLGAYQEMDSELQDIKILLGQVGSKQVAKDAALKREQENIPIFITEEEAIKQLKEEGIKNPTPEQIKAKQDASTKPSTMEEVSSEQSESSKEVAEGVSSELREPSDKGAPQDQSKAAQKEETQIESAEEIDEFFNEELESNEVITPNISRNKADSNAKNKPSTNKIRAIVNSAKMTAKALNKFFPKIRVVIHDNVELFKKTTGKSGRGYYNPNSQTIHINLEKANFTTVPHEAFHALFLEKIKTDPAAARVAERMVKSIERALPKKSALYKRITEYGKKYEGQQEMNEEKMAELFAILSANPTQFKSLPKNVKTQIIDIIDRFFKKVFGASPFTTPDSRTDAKVIEFMETLSGKIRRGETVTEEDVSVLEEIEKETAPKKKVPSKKKAPTEAEAAQEKDRTGREQKTVQEVLEQTNLNIYGFYPANMSFQDQQYVLNLLPAGFDLRKSRVDELGRGGGWMLFDSNGRRVFHKTTRKGRQQMMDKESELISIVALGREKGGFTDGGIKEYLMRRLKNGKREFNAKEINAALKFNTDLFKSMPKSFGNIEGGFMKGIKLLTNIENYYTKLLNKNKKKKGNKKQTIEQLVQETIEYMYTLPAYKESGNPKGKRRTAQQQAMEAEILQYLSPKTTKANSLRVKRLNAAVKDMKWNEKDIKGIQRALRQYIRSVLPISMYRKSEVIEMVDKINRVNKNNYKNILEEITDKVTTMTNQSLEKSIIDILTRKFLTIQSGRLKGVKIDRKTYKRLKSIASNILGGKIDPKKGTISIQIPKNLTAEQINDHNQTILDKIEALSTEMVAIGGVKVKVDKTLSEQEQALVTDLDLAMNFNNSLALEQNDPIKTNALESIEFSLNQLEEMGRTSMQLQLQKDAAGYMDRALKVLADMGVKLDPLGELQREGKENITQQDVIKKFLELKKDLAIDLTRGKQEKLAVTKRFKLAVKTVVKKIETSLIGSSEDLTGLMDRISLSTGEIFGGATQSIVSDQVRKATRMYKARMMANTGIVEAKLTEFLGKKWSRKTMKNSNETESVVINQEKNDIIQKEIDRIGKDTKMTSGERTDLLAQLHKAQNGNTMMMSQNQMLYFYAQGQDPSLLGSFETTFKPTKFSGDLAYLNKEMKNDYNSRVKDEIENKLDKGLKKFGTWLIEEYYPNQYEHYNKTYKEVYRTDMPWNKSYAGRLYRQDADNAEGLDLMPGSDNRSWISNVSAASSKARSENTSAIMKTDGIDALLNYTRDMEYFAAYAIPVRNIHKIFSDGAIKQVIAEKFGKDINTFINDAIEKIANQGVKNQTTVKFINFFNTTFLLSRLGLNPTLTLKQLTSAVTYGNDIGYDNWMKMAASTGIKGIRQDIREILDNSVVLQDRYGRPITRAIETYAETKFEKLNGSLLSQIGLTKQNQNSLTNILMATTMAGDKGAILIGGLPNYRFYKNQALQEGKSPEEAIEIAIVKFEADTLRTQQSYDLQDKDYFQTGNPFSRAFNMFLTTPKQYFRREVIAVRNFYRLARSGRKQGKGTLYQNFRSVWVYHFVMPAFFQWVSMGLPGVFRDRREDDAKEIGLSMLLGNLNALFIIGGIAEDLIATVGLDKPWGTKPSSLPLLEQSAKLNELWQRWDKTKDPLKKKEYMYKLLAEAATLGGIPAPQLRRFADNYSKLLESDDPGEALLRLFNFSEYVQKGPPTKKKKKKKKVRLTQRELRLYYPEIYQEQQRAKEEYEIEYAEEIREAQLYKEEAKREREEYLESIHQ
jgi:hypothetical protein